MLVLMAILTNGYAVTTKAQDTVSTQSSRLEISVGYAYFNQLLLNYNYIHDISVGPLKHCASLGASYTYFFNRVVGVGVRTNVSLSSSTGTYSGFDLSYSGYGGSYSGYSSYSFDRHLDCRMITSFIGPSLAFKGFNYSAKDRLAFYLTPGYMFRRIDITRSFDRGLTVKGDVWGGDFALNYKVFEFDKCNLGLELSYFLGRLVNEDQIYQYGPDEDDLDIYEYAYTKFDENKISRISISLRLGLNL